MASLYKRGSVWWVGYTDAAGKRHDETTRMKKLEQAKAYAAELEAKQQRIRRGLDVDPGDARLTFGSLFEAWWERYGVRLATTGGKTESLRKHVLPEIGALVLREVTPPRLELLFDRMGESLTGSTVNTLRGSLRSIFGWAKKRGLWLGENPVDATERRPELEVERDELTADEVPLVLAQLSPSKRALAAAAIGTGARKGELGALRVEDVDFAAGVVRFGRSWTRNTTKAGTSKSVPIATWLRPYLVEAVAAARARGSAFVFPGPTGGMMRVDVKLASMLRRAMARAGMTRGWLHVCRRRGAAPCDFTERRDHDRVEPCPKCGFRLWPKPIHRAIRWHDLRATTASLLARSGATPAVAGRVLRHSDPSITMKVYTRVRAEDMRSALDAMVPGLAPPAPPAVEQLVRVAANAPIGAAPALQRPEVTARVAADGAVSLAPSTAYQVGPGGFEPPTPTVSRLASPVGTAVRGVSRRTSPVSSRGVVAAAGNATERGSSLLFDAGTAPALQAAPAALLTVRDVAARLSVSTATVYALVDRGELEHVRVSNAIRIEPAALARYVTRGRR